MSIPQSDSARNLSTPIEELALAFAGQRPELAARIHKALEMVREGKIWPQASRPGLFWATGSDGSLYTVGAGSCTCPAFSYHKGPCSHRVARRLWLAVQSAVEDKPATPLRGAAVIVKGKKPDPKDADLESRCKALHSWNDDMCRALRSTGR